jgi:hypothetical protein
VVQENKQLLHKKCFFLKVPHQQRDKNVWKSPAARYIIFISVFGRPGRFFLRESMQTVGPEARGLLRHFILDLEIK